MMIGAFPVFLLLFCHRNWTVSASAYWTDDESMWRMDENSSALSSTSLTSGSAFQRMSQRIRVYTGMNHEATTVKSQESSSFVESRKRKTDDPDGVNIKYTAADDDGYHCDDAYEWIKFHGNEATEFDDEPLTQNSFMFPPELTRNNPFSNVSQPSQNSISAVFNYETPERPPKPLVEPKSIESSGGSSRFSNSSNGSNFLAFPRMDQTSSAMPSSRFSVLPEAISINGIGSGIRRTDEQRREYFERTLFADPYYFARALPPLNLNESLLEETTHEQLKCSKDLKVEVEDDEDLKSVSSECFDEVEIDLSFDHMEEVEFILKTLDEADDSKRPASITTEVSKKLSNFSIDETSPRAKSYQFNKPFLFVNPNTFTPCKRASPIEQSLRKVPSIQCYTSPIPNDDDQMEYKPWIPTDRPSNFTDENFYRLKIKYDLPDFPIETEIIESPETEIGLNYFPDNYKPFQDYGEFVEDEGKSRNAIEIVKFLSASVTEEVIRERIEKLKVNDRDPATSRHFIALNYAKTASEAGLPEGDWIHLFLAGGTVEFSEIPFDPYGPIEDDEWTVRRCREFVSAIVHSVQHMAHFEEVLADFINDLFIKVIRKAKEQAKTPKDSIKLSREVSQACRRLIKALINPTIFDSFLASIKDLIFENDAEELYNALVQIMKEFRVPEPDNLPVRTRPVRPEKKDPKYKAIKGGKEAKRKVYDEDMAAYEKALKEYEKEVSRDDFKARYQDEVIRYRTLQKNRSFDFLKSLVHHLPEPIMKPGSKFQTATLLEMDVPKSSEINTKSFKRKSDKMIFGPNSHENQDFFDALFFSRILRACMTLENTIDFITNHIDPFLKQNQISDKRSPIGLRYLKTINRFMKVTRFNVVANEIPHVINYRRYLVAYLIREGANMMGVDPLKVQSRSITLELLSLFESLHLYQVFDSCSNDMDFRAERLKTLLAFEEISYQIPIIYFTYNPIEYQAAALIIDSISEEVPAIPKNKLNAYFEIFAMARNVPLLSIFNRKILKFKRPPPLEASHNVLENINEDLPLRGKLPENYEAVFEWNMSKRLKSIERTGNHLNYPYGTFASRILLARQFGISFDASYFIPQLNENFTWIESINFANFFLEREAQILINRANTPFLNADSYQVYRVVDSQKRLHQTCQLPMDEPTHYINILITNALKSLPKQESDQILSLHSRKELFQILSKGLMYTNPAIVLNASKESAVKILKYFLDDRNVPVAFDIRLFL